LNYVMNVEWQNGNLLLEQGTAKRRDGSIIEVRDAYFEIESVAGPVNKPNSITGTRVDHDSEVRLPAGLLKTDVEELNQSALNAPLRKEDQAASLPWPIRSATAGLVHATKPVIDWSNLERVTAFQSSQINKPMKDESVTNVRPRVGSIHDDALEDTHQSSNWLASFMKRFTAKSPVASSETSGKSGKDRSDKPTDRGVDGDKPSRK
jgi:hypothetical protein